METSRGPRLDHLHPAALAVVTPTSATDAVTSISVASTSAAQTIATAVPSIRLIVVLPAAAPGDLKMGLRVRLTAEKPSFHYFLSVAYGVS